MTSLLWALPPLVVAIVNAGLWAVLASSNPSEWLGYGLLAGGVPLLLAAGGVAFQSRGLVFAFAGSCVLPIFFGFVVVFCANYSQQCELDYLGGWAMPLGLVGIGVGIVSGIGMPRTKGT